MTFDKQKKIRTEKTNQNLKQNPRTVVKIGPPYASLSSTEPVSEMTILYPILLRQGKLSRRYSIVLEVKITVVKNHVVSELQINSLNITEI